MIECRGRNKWFNLHKAKGWSGEDTSHVSLQSKRAYRDMPPIYFSGPTLEMLAVLARVRGEILDKYAKPYGGWWGEHPEHPRKEWMNEAGANDTGLGYWDWVLNRQEEYHEAVP